MTEVDIEHLRSWIGRERRMTDIITPRLADSLNAVLDGTDPAREGAAAPLGIHWCLAPDIVPMREIGADGHPARGGFLPPVPFPRRMWAGGELSFSGRFLVGDTVSRLSRIEDVTLKTGRSGAMIFVTVHHTYETPRGPVLDERHHIVYRELDRVGGQAQTAKAPEQAADLSRTIEAGPVLLFRYSAITFNGHRIHYDQPYVTAEEGYPGLIFHGPLQATLLLRLAADRRGAAAPVNFSFRSVHPLFSGGTVTANVRADGDALSLWIADQAGNVTMQARC